MRKKNGNSNYYSYHILYNHLNLNWNLHHENEKAFTMFVSNRIVNILVEYLNTRR